MHPLLLLTRPQPQARRFALAVRERHRAHTALINPLTRIVPLAVAPDAFDDAAGVIVTSAHAVPALATLGTCPVYCVGPATTKAALQAGLCAEQVGQDAKSLIAGLQARQLAGPLVHAHGRYLAADIVGALSETGTSAKGVQVYDTQPLPLDPIIAARIQSQTTIAPVFSPRGAQALHEALSGNIPPTVRIVAISSAAALGPRDRIAATPDHDGMLEQTVAALQEIASGA